MLGWPFARAAPTAVTHLHVRSREHLLHLLAEAAELEHNLLCSYLYAAFSLKQAGDAGVGDPEAAALGRWRDSILQVCMEEMAHLAQVANLMVAVGARPHFDRPNLPVAPGYHPAGIQIALRPFDLQTLDHFIFLERPEEAALGDAPAFRSDAPAPRLGQLGVLMPSAPDYATIGEFYQLLESGFTALSERLGEGALFFGPAEHQLRAEEIGIDELSVVIDLRSAVRAIELIVVQGEGAPGHDEHSHFEQFQRIRREYDQLLAEQPSFAPSRPVATHPVMRAPMADDRVHVTGAAAAPVLDAANAVYSLMLRCLAAVYDTPWRDGAGRKALLGAATGLMKLLRELSDVLTTLPAQDGGALCAGVSFAMLRSTEGLVAGIDVRRVVSARLRDIAAQLPALALPPEVAARMGERLAGLIETMGVP